MEQGKQGWPAVHAGAGLLAYSALVLFIAAVSVHDAALVVLNDQTIAQAERNPLGRWLIQANGENVWLFVIVKLVCTAIACAVLIVLYQCWRRVAFVVAAAVAGFQLGLLLYLSLA